MNEGQPVDLPLPSAVRGLNDLSGRVALVTGAASGLGRAIAWGFACAGADVAIIDRDGSPADAYAAQVAAATGRHAAALFADVSDERGVDDAVAGAVAELGPIDVLVNCAGHNISKALVEYSQAEFDSLLHVHVRGAFLLCRAVGRQMQSRRRGSIINIASILAHVGVPGASAYAAAKGGLIQLTKVLALEMAPYGVRVNAIAPGFIDTPLTRRHAPEVRRRIVESTPLGRFGEARELIGSALFLASDASSYVTGSSLVVDGGWTAQ